MTDSAEEFSKPYKKLLAKRDNLVKAIFSHVEKIKTGSISKSMAISRKLSLEGSRQKYISLMDDIIDSDEYDPDHLTVDHTDVEDAYHDAVSAFNDIIEASATNTEAMSLETTIATRTSENIHSIKLPTIKLPSFGGKRLAWTTFYDTFSSLVDQNATIDKINKFHYLRDSLTGEAFRTISKIPVSQANYDTAWQLLQDKYHNKRAIVNDCLKELLFQQPIAKQNAADLRNLIDTTKECVQSIEVLDVSIDDWDPFLVYVVQTKLDNDIAIEWEKKLGGSKEIPKYIDMMDFLETQHRILSTPAVYQSSSQRIHMIKTAKADQKKKDHCEACQSEHYVLFCPTFNGWTVPERKRFVDEKKLCSVCLKKHDIQNCTSKFRCKTCNGQHSTKLHGTVESPSQIIHALQDPSAPQQKLLATAVLKALDKFGTYHLLCALIDQGSEGIVISESAVQMLRLSHKHENVPLTGLDNISLGKAKKSVRLQVKSAVDESFVMSMDALVMRSITQSGPKFKNGASWKHLDGLKLADPHFLNARKFDIMLGVDIYGILIKDGLRKGKINELVAQNSSLGWLVFGAACDAKSYNVRIHTIQLLNKNNDDSDLNTALKRFWENEEVKLKPIMTEEHEKCVALCKKSTIQLPDGRLQVSLPFNMNPNEPNFLGDSRKMALRRFFHLEKKFEREPVYYERYKADMLDYLKSNHMSLSKSPLTEGFIVPHHAVTREESTTTKQRMVFDASAKTTNGFSLNDRCLNGPTIQPELFDIFIRWRTHKIALVADIKQMYRQISLAPEDRKYQKILWRFSKEEPIQTYEINCVMFGGKPAPFMAINATFFLAEMKKDEFPEAAKRVKTDFYVDDCMSGSHSVQHATKLQCELNQLFNAGHMQLRKWASNDEAALQGIPIEHRAINTSLTLSTSESIKTLGMKWTPTTDLLNFTIDMSRLSSENQITKRKLVSDASKLYDPCGLLAPITIKAKILMQKTFKEKVNWDEEVSTAIQNEWRSYKEELPLIKQIKIDRWLKVKENSVIHLHGFCDASDFAFSACIYLVQTSNGTITSSLVCAKTRVAPMEPVPTPRLELCGAVLLANLASRIENNLQINKDNVHLWTDSSVVWHWIQSHPSRFQVYVAHRVNEIQQLYPAKHWRHVRTHENPADIASRGVSASHLINNSLWFSGPHWLLLEKANWPKINLQLPPDTNLEEKRVNINITVPQIEPCETEFLRRFSDFTRLLRVTARLLRLVHRYKKETKGFPTYVTATELDNAKIRWVKYVQSIHFTRDIADIKANKVISKNSALRSLNPKLNENGILVVDGRLRYALLPERQKYPMILPAKSHLSHLIINSAHMKTLHGTIHLTLAHTRQEFWILNGRNLVKEAVHKCVPCFRQRPTPMRQLMAPLPAYKTSPADAFAHCGLDFAGPIMIKSSDKRNAPSVKGYICVFVCMVSKACHLELVGDLSTQRFILALRRLIGRRGNCTDVYCDCGTNFQGASNELPQLFLQASSSVSTEIAHLFAADGITFHFNPPSAPNWGGQWESYVKLTKHHIRRMTTARTLTYEEMSTLLIQIEACINSRPLCSISSDPNDLDPLTPAHLLIGRPLNVIPEPSLLSLKDQTLDRFQIVQKSLQVFWQRFFSEYLHTLHPRKKWQQTETELEANDLVIVMDDNTPPAKWISARVISTHPSKDGLHRVAKLRTKNGEYTRPIVKLCKLPITKNE